MEILYKKAQSKEKPATIDVVSSPECVYIRRDIKLTETENESGEISKIYDYQEAVLSKNDYEQYKNTLLVNEINNNENSSAFENYQNNFCHLEILVLYGLMMVLNTFLFHF